MLKKIQCPVCCTYFGRDFDLVFNPDTNELECESDDPRLIEGGGTDCGFHVPAATPIEEIRGKLYQQRLKELRAISDPKV